MTEMLSATIKEGTKKVAEERGETLKNLERMESSESQELSSLERKIAHEADTETAMHSSLASVLQENREKREAQEEKNCKLCEHEEQGGRLTDDQKGRIRELTTWSNEIIDAISSWEESEIYIRADLKEAEFNGKKCFVRDDIDLDQKDEDGITNRERMERGRPPITNTGEDIELHHVGQKQNSPLAELTMVQHRGMGNDAVLHDKTKETEIDRGSFGKERSEHWKKRAESMRGSE